MDLRIGCSGWSYNHWRNGVFYPAKLSASRWLQHYASVFDTVELNGTFYRLPTEKAVLGWRDGVPDGFRFAAKVSRLITHFRRLRNCEEALQAYVQRIRLLDGKLGPLLYQLPPNLGPDPALLRDFLAVLPADLTHVFEFRNEAWWTERTFGLLRDHGAGFCVYHKGREETPVAVTNDLLYLRFHGPQHYSGRYSDSLLRTWARRIEDCGAREAWVYFNNDLGGHAPRDAVRLREMLAPVKHRSKSA